MPPDPSLRLLSDLLPREDDEQDLCAFPPPPSTPTKKRIIYRERLGLVNLDSVRQSTIEAPRSERRGPSPNGKGEEEDRLGQAAASPNSPNLTVRGIPSIKNNVQFMNVERPKYKAPAGDPDAGNPLWVVEDPGTQKTHRFWGWVVAGLCLSRG